MAQEESICYRSSLALSLPIRYYPLPLDGAIYSPYVLVMRDDIASGHNLLNIRPRNLPVVSVVTVAALRRPDLIGGDLGVLKDRKRPHDYDSGRHQEKFLGRDMDRDLTKAKMRLALRIAAIHKHPLLVLDALGCGAYENPPAEIAHCWLEVLKEYEFSGNWWKEVCFAVYDPNNDGNFAVFDRILAGKYV